ncbi:MAG: CPBP family intramembrane metalloprotease [Candidatus Aminicenantes bacterium]|nr:CPBP family intramembrane metalloprotease [Candidatus Aminicenantes bacterium]MDH5386370.1 CPBP family intramembrane metalloprotease [Candidatus Aminicenantes bacterium]MDH5745316.1 CPBP family intramembrane metalloprotease [Candidatus Aminicenantes bacterium]
MESTKEVRKRIITFVFITYGISSIFMYLAISTGSLRAGGGLVALGGMCSPGIAAILTQLLYRKSLREFGWKWGKTTYQVWSYAVPALYALTIHAFVWMTGLAGFVQDSPTELIITSLKMLAIGTVLGSIFALGEEIGWQGFFVPLLARVTSFTNTALLRGIVWSVWHYPLIIFGVYGAQELPVWYKLISFTVMLTGVSFAFAWFRLKSGSLWTGMFLHASHNLFVQGLPGLTTDKGMTVYLIDEFGAVSAAVALIVAFIFWKKRGQLTLTPTFPK